MGPCCEYAGQADGMAPGSLSGNMSESGNRTAMISGPAQVRLRRAIDYQPGIIVPVSMKRWCQAKASAGSIGDCRP